MEDRKRGLEIDLEESVHKDVEVKRLKPFSLSITRSQGFLQVKKKNLKTCETLSSKEKLLDDKKMNTK